MDPRSQRSEERDPTSVVIKVSPTSFDKMTVIIHVVSKCFMLLS